MIGQTHLWNNIYRAIERDRFPRFSILVGEHGSGKHYIARSISLEMIARGIYIECTAESIRNAISSAYTVTDKAVYIIENVDNMSASAANAMLKVTEEPPNNAYFILLCENEMNLLQTIRSRAVVYYMEPYTYDELLEYIETLGKDASKFLLDFATTPGELKELYDMDYFAFEDYVNLVINNIAEVNGANALKIGDKINLKDDPKKYDLRLFWKAVMAVCADKMVANTESEICIKYGKCTAITAEALQTLAIKGINKQMLFDKWVLDIRGVLL